MSSAVRSNRLIVTVCLLAGAFAGVAVGGPIVASATFQREPTTPALAISSAFPEPDPSDVVAYPPFPRNERGMTYGSGQYVDADNLGPELQSAYGTDGTLGYLRAEDLAEEEPRGLVDPSTYDASDRVIPLYAQDGVTVVGEFRITAPITKDSR